MSILHTIAGSAISGLVSRIMYTAIDNVSTEQSEEKRKIWWFVLVGLVVLVVSIVILCIKHEREGELHDKKESFEMYGSMP